MYGKLLRRAEIVALQEKERAYSVPVPQWALERKQRAAQCFRSQFESSTASTPVLPSFVLPRLMAVGEVVFR